MRKNDIFKDYLENKHPNYLYLLLPLPLGVIMLIIRHIFLRFIFIPVRKYFATKKKPINAKQNKILENAFARGKMNYRTITKLSKKLKWTKKEIKDWFQIRLSQDKQPGLENFNESRFIFQPVGQYLGLQGRLLIAQQNEMLENAFASGQMDYRTIAKLSKKIQWTKKEIKEWFKIRHSQKEVPDLGNFCESSWRCFYATCSFTYGIFFFWNMPWLWDIKECYYDHPFHEVTNNMWWYFLINMAYYWMLLAFLHLSWYVNLVRLGIIIILGMVFGDMIAEDFGGGLR
ncbi:hypothetical protein M0804_013378 [Polistes exclamans]|nr:hypothetical protein M0804_013378 [Polistes exclamans]